MRWSSQKRSSCEYGARRGPCRGREARRDVGNVRNGWKADTNDRFQIPREHNVGRPVERRMSNSADQLRAKARQTRFLARQAFIRSRSEALHSLATVYESQAAELERTGSLGL